VAISTKISTFSQRKKSAGHNKKPGVTLRRAL
jgi:hypothetical protein